MVKKAWLAVSVSGALGITAIVGGLAAQSSPAEAQARVVRCELTINGRTYIRGQCDFTPLGRDGSFQIMDHEDQPYFAQVNVSRPGIADGYWNGDRTNERAHARLGQLTRRQACWVNQRVRVCAW
jgi:hypothetical protein